MAMAMALAMALAMAMAMAMALAKLVEASELLRQIDMNRQVKYKKPVLVAG